MSVLQTFNCKTFIRKMSQTSQKINYQQQQLPSIDKKDQYQTSRDQFDTPRDNNNAMPLTHTKKKKKPKKKTKKHSPEHYEEIKIKKINKKLEERWDSHFVNDQIPNFYEKKKITRKTLSKIVDDKRTATAFNNRAPQNKTVDLGLKKQSLPLPKIQKPDKRSKSFNIHVVNNKNQDPKVHQKSQDASVLLQAKLSKQLPQRKIKTTQQVKKPVAEKSNLDEYTIKLNALFEEKKFLYSHKEMMECLFERIDRRHVKEIVDKELGAITKDQSIINKVMKAIQNRENFLKKVEDSLLDSNKDIESSFDTIDHYRTSTLAAVQEILKWKQTWQGVYFEIFKKTKVLDLVHKTQNYLLTLASDTDQLLEKFYQRKQNQLTLQNSATKNKQERIKIETKQQKQQKQQKLATEPKYLNHIEQKQTSHPTEQKHSTQIIEQVSSTSQLHSNKKIGENKEAATLEVQKRSSNSHIKPQHQSTLNPTRSKQIQKTKNQQTNQVPKPIIPNHQDQRKTSLKKQSNDPFLIGVCGIEKEDNNFVLKIRACELLLIQQQYNFLKK